MRFISQKAEVDSRAELGENVYVASFASVRADEGLVRIGDNTSIQESCVLHGSVEVGKNVTVGHAAVLHGCKIADNVLVGMNATVMDGVEVGEWSIIAAGAVVTPNTRVPSNSVVAGVPAKIIRQTKEKDRELIRKSAENYLEKLRKLSASGK